MPYFILPEDTPSSVAYASPNVQSQLSYNLFPETPTGIALSQITYDAPQGITQDPYLSLQNTHDPTLLPQTTIDLSDNVRNCILSPVNPAVFRVSGSIDLYGTKG